MWDELYCHQSIWQWPFSGWPWYFGIWAENVVDASWMYYQHYDKQLMCGRSRWTVPSKYLSKATNFQPFLDIKYSWMSPWTKISPQLKIFTLSQWSQMSLLMPTPTTASKNHKHVTVESRKSNEQTDTTKHTYFWFYRVIELITTWHIWYMNWSACLNTWKPETTRKPINPIV